MNKVFDYAINIPFFCESVISEEASEVIAFIFRDEGNGNKVFRRRENHKKNPRDRYRMAFAFTKYAHNEKAAEHCLDLCELLDHAHHKYAHNEDGHDSDIADLWSKCAEEEKKFPKIAEMMSADMAASEEVAVLYGWD